MRLFILALCIGAAVASMLKKPSKMLFYQDPDDIREQFEQFKVNYGKDYSMNNNNENEDDRRFEIFKDNVMRASVFQSMERGSAEYGVTQFSDLTADEFAALHTIPHLKYTEQEVTPVKHLLRGYKPPVSVDWRELGAVNPVEQQGACGSCWAFSAVGNIEGQWFRKTGELIALSKQQLVDCDRSDYGCSGGWPSMAYESIKLMGGIQAQKTYPYKAAGDQCSMEKEKYVAYVNGSVRLPVNEEIQASWLARNGPMSVALNADLLQFYRGGITHPWSMFCSASGLNHAVLTVGYGVENGKPYWLVKNSWGPGWGEKGYFRIYRGEGTCGIDQVVTSAVIV